MFILILFTKYSTLASSCRPNFSRTQLNTVMYTVMSNVNRPGQSMVCYENSQLLNYISWDLSTLMYKKYGIYVTGKRFTVISSLSIATFQCLLVCCVCSLFSSSAVVHQMLQVFYKWLTGWIVSMSWSLFTQSHWHHQLIYCVLEIQWCSLVLLLILEDWFGELTTSSNLSTLLHQSTYSLHWIFLHWHYSVLQTVVYISLQLLHIIYQLITMALKYHVVLVQCWILNSWVL